MSNAIAKLPTTTLAKMSEQEWESLIGVLAGFQSLAGKKFNAEDKMQRYTLDLEISILQDYYPELTLANVEEALKLAHVGKLKNFGVTGKTVIENIPELLNAYNEYLLDGKNMIQAVEEEPQEVKEQKNAKTCSGNNSGSLSRWFKNVLPLKQWESLRLNMQLNGIFYYRRESWRMLILRTWKKRYIKGGLKRF
jgi:hypothetical protein